MWWSAGAILDEQVKRSGRPCWIDGRGQTLRRVKNVTGYGRS